MCTHGDKEGARRLAVAYVWICEGRRGKEAGSGICVNMWRKEGARRLAVAYVWICEGGGKEAGYVKEGARRLAVAYMCKYVKEWICEGGGKEAGSGIYEGGKDGSGICVNIWRRQGGWQWHTCEFGYVGGKEAAISIMWKRQGGWRWHMCEYVKEARGLAVALGGWEGVGMWVIWTRLEVACAGVCLCSVERRHWLLRFILGTG